MAKRLYVGNISFKMTEDELKELFGSVGVVEDAKIITDRETGRSRGFGFVTMEKDSQATAAIDSLNGRDVGGRTLTVNEAREKDRNDGGYQKKTYSAGGNEGKSFRNNY